MKKKYLEAALHHFFAQKARAEANLVTYLENPVGVGEHSDVVAEVINMIEKIDHAKSCIETIQAMVKPAEEQKENNDGG